jgi:hypothetical protein
MSTPRQKTGTLTGLERAILTRLRTEIAVGSLFCNETAARPVDPLGKSAFA